MEAEQKAFMQSIIKQCSNFFLSLHKYCEEYAASQFVNAPSAKKPSKKSAAAQPEESNPKAAAQAQKAKKKKTVDPDKPKKPLTPFFRFFMKRREELKNDYPDFNATDITETLGKEWRALPEKEKMFFKNEFNKDYEVFKDRLLEYCKKKGIDPASLKNERRKRKKKGGADEDEAEIGKRSFHSGQSEGEGSDDDEEEKEEVTEQSHKSNN